MLLTLLPIMTLVRLVQSVNAPSPMLVTVLGIVMLESGVKTHSGAAFEARVTGVVTRFLASTLTALVVK